jgi:hypothetical protein
MGTAEFLPASVPIQSVNSTKAGVFPDGVHLRKLIEAARQLK